MSWKEYGLTRQEVMEVLANHIAKREGIDRDEHRGQVEFTVFRDRTTGILSVDFVKVRFELKTKAPTEPPPAPAFM